MTKVVMGKQEHIDGWIKMMIERNLFDISSRGIEDGIGLERLRSRSAMLRIHERIRRR